MMFASLSHNLELSIVSYSDWKSRMKMPKVSTASGNQLLKILPPRTS
eukprot:UN09905